MTTLQYPTFTGITDFQDGTIYLRADDTSIEQYCADRGVSLVSYEAEEQRFSNDGALAYQYYGPFTGTISPGVTGTTTKWQLEFGFSKIVQTLVTE
jgi:hypothetical protein